MCFLAVRTTVAVFPTAVIGSVKDMTWRGNSYSIRIKPVCLSHGGWTLCLSHANTRQHPLHKPDSALGDILMMRN